MTKILRKFLDVLIGFICVIAVIFICLMLIGVKPYVVMSGSMGDSLPAGSLCFVDTKYDYSRLKVGDVIAYSSGKVRVTHRVHEMSDGLIRTKGDANDSADMYFIGEEHYLGLTKYYLPRVGFAVNWMQSDRGRIFSATAAICLLLLNFMVEDEDKKSPQPSKPNEVSV